MVLRYLLLTAALVQDAAPPRGRVASIGCSEICVVRTDGTGFEMLTGSAGRKACLTWSPDGRSIAFLETDKDTGLFTVDVVDRTVTPLVTNREAPRLMPWQLSWSPDGKQIAFLAHPGEDGTDIHVVERQTKKVRRLTQTAGRSPSWSPDGKSIAYMGVYGGLFVIDADDGNPKRLADGIGRDTFPSWSPDGRTIAFQSYRDDGGLIGEIYTIGIDGKGLKKVIEGWNPVWSRDGMRLVHTRGDSLRSCNALGEDLKVLATKVDGIDRPSISPDGRWIDFWTSKGLALVRADGGPTIRLADSSHDSATWRPE